MPLRLARRASARRAVSIVLAVGIAVGGAAALSGCSLARNVVEGATGGSVDIGGKSVPKSFPTADVPLTTAGDVIYGASLKTQDGQGWNVTFTVSGEDSFAQIADQLTSAGFIATDTGKDDQGSTGTFTKGDYVVVVLVTKSDDATGWTASYTVTKGIATATPTPTATSGS